MKIEKLVVGDEAGVHEGHEFDSDGGVVGAKVADPGGGDLVKGIEKLGLLFAIGGVAEDRKSVV